MAGFSGAYWIGDPGGFLGADGMNSIRGVILIGNADRQWLEGGSLDLGENRLGKILTIVPGRPDEPAALLDACLAFFTLPFRALPAHADVVRDIGAMTHLDFDQQAHRIPESWFRLRREAQPIFRQLFIMRGTFVPVDLTAITIS